MPIVWNKKTKVEALKHTLQFGGSDETFQLLANKLRFGNIHDVRTLMIKAIEENKNILYLTKEYLNYSKNDSEAIRNNFV